MIVSALLGVAGFRLLRRTRRTTGFVKTVVVARAPRNYSRNGAAGAARCECWRFEIYEGTPFAAGLCGLTSCSRARMFGALERAARDAVNRARARSSTTPRSGAVLLLGLVSDVFFFRAGQAAALRRVTRDLELSADHVAPASGPTRAGLVNALLALAEGKAEPTRGAGSSAAADAPAERIEGCSRPP